MSDPEAIFLRRFFCLVDASDIRYAVMRNADCLPDSLNGSDVDILVSVGSSERIAQLARKAAVEAGGRAIVDVSVPHMRQLMFLGNGGDGWWGACIDLFEGVYCRGAIPLFPETVLDRRCKTRNGIWVLEEAVGQYLGFTKELLVHGKYSDRYAPIAKRLLEVEKDCSFVPSRVRGLVEQALSVGTQIGSAAKKKLIVGFLIRHPLLYLWRRFAYERSRLSRYLHPAGRMVVVMGTDGSGKSTLLSAIAPVLKTMCHKQLVIHHLKPDLLPPLGRFRGVKYEPGHVCTNPHGSKPSGFVGSLIRIVYLSMDYILGYWLRVRWHVSKIPTGIWIFDRYVYDMLIDPLRFRIKLPVGIVRFFVRLLPSPDLVLCLGGSPEKIFARKPETSLDEVRRQVHVLKSFCNSCHNAVWIDTTVELDESRHQALEAILKDL